MSKSPALSRADLPRPRKVSDVVLALACVAGALYGGWHHNIALIAGMCLLLSYYVQRLGAVWRWLPVVLGTVLMLLTTHLHGLIVTEQPSLHAASLRAIGTLSILVGLALYAIRQHDYQRERRALRRTLQAVNIGSERLTQARTQQQLWQVGSEMLRELEAAPHFALLAYQTGATTPHLSAASPPASSLPASSLPASSLPVSSILGAGGEFIPFLHTTLPTNEAAQVRALIEPAASQRKRRYWHTFSISGQQAQPFGMLVMARSKRPFDSRELTIVQAFVRLLGAQLGQAQALSELRAANDLTLRSLGAALEQRDNETSGHTMRVVNLSIQMTRSLSWSEERIDAMRWGAYLHDLGKIAVPDAILHKNAQLTPEERAVMQSHTLQGCEMLRELPFLPAETLDIVRYHHERWDGQGYPAGLRGQDIPEVARIFSIVDVYDALTSSRPYKAAWSVEETLQELRRQAGTQFDPHYVEIFAQLIQENAAARSPQPARSAQVQEATQEHNTQEHNTQELSA